MGFGKLASELGLWLPVRVLQSFRGFYLGTANEEGPVSRESEEYWPTREAATSALADGRWTQKVAP